MLPTKLCLWFLAFFLCALPEPSAGTVKSDSSATSENVLRLYRGLKALRFDPAQTGVVRNLILVRDRARFNFKEGTFYFAQPAGGRVTGAVFLGTGWLDLSPPNEVERHQVRRFLESHTVHEAFSAAYLRFTDSTYAELTRQIQRKPAPIPARVTQLHERTNKYLLRERGFNLSAGLLGDLLHADGSGVFLAVLQQTRGRRTAPGFLLFAFEPDAREEVSLYQFFPKRTNKPFYTICSFHQASEYAPGDSIFPAVEDSGDALRTEHYRLDVRLKKSGRIQVSAELRFTTDADSLRLAPWTLYQELRVDSVKSAAGTPLTFIQEEKEAGFTVVFERPVRRGERRRVTVFYSGKALEPADGNLLLKNRLYWYPRSGYLQRATYDVRFRYPRKWHVVAVGKQVERRTADGDAYSRWQVDAPALGTAFAFGYLDSTRFHTPDGRPITVFSTYEHNGRMRKHIAGDVSNALYFFQSLFGPYPFDRLNVAESPGPASQGFPGLLFLTQLTYTRELEGVMEILRSHEVAHQWWGNLIGWQTYHDQWLSEGLAEYSGALATQFMLQDDRRFFQILEGWRNDLLLKGHIGVSVGLRRFGFSKRSLADSEGLDAGAVWLGRRLGAKHAVDYYLVTYEKAAYVLHMLRVLLRDFETGSDQRFFELLRDFVTRFRGRRVSTRDFMTVVQDHFEEDMSWFFRQWIFGVAVPTYYYSYEVEHAGPAKYWVALTVRQEKVPDDFKMYVPVSVHTETSESTRLILVDAPQKAFRLGPFSARPTKLVFNAYAGVLARVKKE